MSSATIELLSLAVVREYLSRKGYKSTLTTFDEETKMKNQSIQNRRKLAEELKILDLVKENKKSTKDHLKCFIEIIVKHLKEQSYNRNVERSQIKRSDLSGYILNQDETHSRIILSSTNLGDDQEQPLPGSDTIQETDIARKDCCSCRCNNNNNSNRNGTGTVSRRRRRKSSRELNNENNVPKATTTTTTTTAPTTTLEEAILLKNPELKESSSFEAVRSTSFIEELRKKKEQGSSPRGKIETYLPENQLSTDTDNVFTDGHRIELNMPENQISTDTRNNISIGKDRIESSITENKFSNDKNKSRAVVDSISLGDAIESRIPEKKALRTTMSKIVILDDFDLDLEDKATLDSNHQVNDRSREEFHMRVEPVTLETAVELKTIIFGSASRSFNPEWMQQGFHFSTHPLLTYGLVQDKGGPCGLLAAVQAWVLKILLLNDRGRMKNAVPSPTPEEQTAALVDALTQILWLVCSNDEVVVTLLSKQSKFNCSAKYKADNVTEKLDLYVLNDRTKLRAFLKQNVPAFCGEHGFVLFLYSAILSRGINNVRNSMDEVINGTLLGSHGYCTQDMVNLLLTGTAVSNVFDGIMELGCGNEKTILHGIEKQSDIGFLSLYEHYNSCEVGSNYKTPRHPIWVVCSESHFSVLFAVRDLHIQLVAELTQFDLYYFDGLGKQNEEIRLTITLPTADSRHGYKAGNNYKLDLIPPLDHCIRTKWEGAEICWNDTDPLL